MSYSEAQFDISHLLVSCAHIARFFNDVGTFSMLKINLCYFSSRARLNFRWIFKEFDLKSNMKGFYCFIGKETEESVDDSSLNHWPWTSVSRMLSLYARLSLGTCSHRLPIFIKHM